FTAALQADGKIVVAGYSNNGVDNDFMLARYDTDGSLDTSFGGGDGFTTTAIGSGGDIAWSLALQADGKIVLAGQSSNGSNDDFAYARYNSDGTLDTTFDSVPLNTLNGTPSFTEGGAAVVLDADVTISEAELDALNSGNGNYDGASVTLVRNGGASADDVFSATGTLSALTESGNLVVGATTIGTVTTNSAGTLMLTFNTNATTALVNSAMQQIAYSNSSDTPPASAQIDWMFDDGNTGSQGTGGALDVVGSTTVTIEATPAQDDSYSTSEDDTLNVAANGVLGNDAPGAVSGPETAGHRLSFDAANDGDTTWNDDNATGFDWTIGNFGTDVTHTNSPTTAYSGITAAYQFTGVGGATTSPFEDLP
ncbi:MAG: hypothetical protein GY747_10185, partial [Planctomycetes bacterium]|nr:hypothetical protein [Planctomycetota bacterium]